MGDLKHVAIGWKALAKIINGIIDQVNNDTPLEGDGIRIIDTANGKLISTSALAQTGGSSAGIGAGKTSQFATNTLIWIGVKWQDVIVVDPDTCEQSTLKMLVSTEDAADYVYISLAAPLVAAS